MILENLTVNPTSKVALNGRVRAYIGLKKEAMYAGVKVSACVEGLLAAALSTVGMSLHTLLSPVTGTASTGLWTCAS